MPAIVMKQNFAIILAKKSGGAFFHEGFSQKEYDPLERFISPIKHSVQNRLNIKVCTRVFSFHHSIREYMFLSRKYYYFFQRNLTSKTIYFCKNDINVGSITSFSLPQYKLLLLLETSKFTFSGF